MLGWLEKCVVKGRDIRDERVRSAYGKAVSVICIASNVLLFAGKALAGVLSSSVAITADAFNNLSDASSGAVSLLGFKLAEKPADAEHPYGHGRFEYLSALVVAAMVLVIGVEMLKSGVQKILHPQAVRFDALTAGILLASIAVKLWLAWLNRRAGERIDSGVLAAASQDSRNDVIATGAVLLSMVIGRLTGVPLDGVMGAAVAVFILVSGYTLMRDTIDPLLGGMPDKERTEAIRAKIMAYPGVLGVHDLMVHDYGPGRQFASVHVEMSSSEDPLHCHDIIDNIERDFLMQDGLHLVIHYDPVATDDPRLPVMRDLLVQIVQEIDPRITVHDLRMVPGKTHVNIVFDCVLPYGLETPVSRLRGRICERVQAQYPDYYCVITFEHDYARGGE
ncbi:MAG: cation transporter [Clostridia bacterium]|nr:cation transporter [Clostridia bacterium]